MGIARIKRCYKAGLGTKTFLILWVAKLEKWSVKKTYQPFAGNPTDQRVRLSIYLAYPKGRGKPLPNS